MPFTGYQFARMKIVDVGTHLDDLSDELMADRHGNRDRLARPIVPIVDVDIRAANSCAKTRIKTSLIPMVGSGTPAATVPVLLEL